MTLPQRHRRKAIWAGGALLALLLIHPLRDLIFVGRLLLNLGAAANEEVATEGISRSEILLEHPAGKRRAIVYRLHGEKPTAGLMMVPGLTIMGADHPRLVVLARALSNLGYLVITPDIADFRLFKLKKDAIKEMGFWCRYLKDELHLEQIGVVGISVAGTLALITAAQPEVQDKISYVVSIGGYSNLFECNRIWFSARDSYQRHGDYPVHYYGRWISMLAALGALKSPSDAEAVAKVLRHLLAKGKAPAEPPVLSSQAKLWYQLAVKNRFEDPELLQQINGQLWSDFNALSPKNALDRVRQPVFLVHGSNDELIPSNQTLELEKQLTSTEVHVLITPFISHTHPRFRELSWFKKLPGYLESFRFLYAFAHYQTIEN